MFTRFLFLTVCGLFFISANASDSAKILIGDFSFDDIPVKNLDFDISLGANGLEIIARADSIKLAHPVGLLTKLELHCNKLLLQSDGFACERGQFSFNQHDVGQQKVAFNLVAAPQNEHYRITMSGLNIASAELNINASVEKNNWQAHINSNNISLPELISFLSLYLSEDTSNLLSNWRVDGDIKLLADISSQNDRLKNIDLKFAVERLNLNDDASQYVTEGVATLLSLNLSNEQHNWQWKMDLNIDEGQGYGEPVFIDFNLTPASLVANGHWQQDKGEFYIEHAVFEQKDIVKIKGDFTGDFKQLNQLNIKIEQADTALVYQHWLQPFLIGTAVDDLELAGVLNIDYEQQGKDYQVSLDLDNVYVNDLGGRFSIDGLSGVSGWSNSQHPVQIELVWESGHIYAVPIGQSNIKAQAKSSSLILLEPWQLPVLDGALHINDFSLHRPSGQHSTWSFEGLVTPISMESLSATLEWPILHGKLSGVIPQVSYADKHIKVDGALLIKLFDGSTVIRDLKLEEPFGVLPQLFANVDLTGLDLDILTQTFDFGKITGKLDGTLENLRLSNWRPVQFDASFATPDGDKSRRRISQKAIDNLSQIGGGAGGLLSRSFLRFFEDFSYQKLGLSCQLRNEVCEMSGVGDTEQGYYIVKGGGLPPRINVVGYTRQVNWPDLIERLSTVSQSAGPVVQ